MSSPAPWNDAVARINAAALVPANLIAWPNSLFQPPEPPALWLAVEMAGDVLEPIELGPNGAWCESGRLYVHVMVPTGWGTDAARVMAKAVCNVFRGVPAQPVVWRGANIGLGEVAEPDGAWWALTVAVSYDYTDTVTG